MRILIFVCLLLLSACAHQSDADRQLNDAITHYNATHAKLAALIQEMDEKGLYIPPGMLTPSTTLSPLPAMMFPSVTVSPSQTFHGPQFYEVLPPGGQIHIYQVSPQYPY